MDIKNKRTNNSMNIGDESISSQATHLRVVNDPDDFEDDPPLTQQQEANRQTAELLEKYPDSFNEPEW